MKPYQLLGLSFLVYLYNNGLSGILGDEMGLGKTLQTLSLIQYLKESQKHSKSSDELRPCLVVCPLSVLSSWMAESRRWTPGLKVLRFHGSVHERDRLKRIAMGYVLFGIIVSYSIPNSEHSERQVLYLVSLTQVSCLEPAVLTLRCAQRYR